MLYLVLLGYCQQQKGYKCLHVPTNKIYINRNIRFDENTFPFAFNSPLPSHSTTDLPHFSNPFLWSSIYLTSRITPLIWSPLLISYWATIEQLDVRFIFSKDQFANLFTKSLIAARLEFLRIKPTLCSTSDFVWGVVSRAANESNTNELTCVWV
jgi:hypothetical protein